MTFGYGLCSGSARAWRNWQTHQIQNLAPKGVGVRGSRRAPDLPHGPETFEGWT